MRRSVLLILLALAVTPAATSHAQPAGPDPADVRFREGNAAYKQKRYAEAKAAYEDAFRLKQTHDIAANLGFAEVKLELWRDAATHLAFALRNWPPTGKAASRESAVQFLGVAKEKIATLTITVAVGADVLIDGKPAGTAPLEELFVEPGTHTVGAKRDGYEPAEQAVQAEKGKTSAVALTLVPVAPPPPTASVSASAPPPLPTASATTAPPIKPPKPLIVTTGVLGAAGLAAGIGFTVAANGKGATRTTLLGKVGQSGCFQPASASSADCTNLLNTAKSQSSLRNGAVAAYAVGGGLALVTAGLLVWTARKPAVPNDGVRIQVAPALGATDRGVVVNGTW
jgi:hypothetical protein